MGYVSSNNTTATTLDRSDMVLLHLKSSPDVSECFSACVNEFWVAWICPFHFNMLERTYFSLWKLIDIKVTRRAALSFSLFCILVLSPSFYRIKNEKEFMTFGLSPTCIDNPAMQIFMPKWFPARTDLHSSPVLIKCQSQRKEILSNTCLFCKAESTCSFLKVYLVVKIWVHNLILYKKFYAGLTFEEEKN